MSSIHLSAPVVELVAEPPERGQVFEKYGIDHCCCDKKPLGSVCLERGLDPGEVIEKLEISDTYFSDDADWRNAPLTKLVDHIESVHHAYLKVELPRLSARIAKLARLLWKRYPEMQRLAVVFEDFRAYMEAHITKEERILFPMCRSLETARFRPQFHCANPIQVMEIEHESARLALEKMRAITQGFTVPGHAGGTYRTVLQELARLEEDTHQHMHKENNILFPRAAALEAALPER